MASINGSHSLLVALYTLAFAFPPSIFLASCVLACSSWVYCGHYSSLALLKTLLPAERASPHACNYIMEALPLWNLSGLSGSPIPTCNGSLPPLPPCFALISLPSYSQTMLLVVSVCVFVFFWIIRPLKTWKIIAILFILPEPKTGSLT